MMTLGMQLLFARYLANWEIIETLSGIIIVLLFIPFIILYLCQVFYLIYSKDMRKEKENQDRMTHCETMITLHSVMKMQQFHHQQQ